MAEFWRKYATATHIYIPIVKRGVVDFAVGADWTPVAGDVKVSIDGGAVANVATLPVAIASGNGAFWDFALSSGETTGKKISVITVDAATKAVEDQMFDILTYGNASAELIPDYSAALATPTNITAGTITTVTTLTNLPSIPANWLTAAGIAAAALNGKGDWNTTTPPTTAAIATGVWTDTTAGDFTAANSIGKSVMNGVALGSGLHTALVDTVTTYTGNTPQTGDSFVRLGAPVGASISADIAEIEGETDLIVTATAGITYTVANQVDVNVVDWKGAVAPAMTGDAFARLGAPVGASISADIAEVEGETDAIIATLGTPAAASVSADIAALNNISAAQVKTQVVAALNTDTYAEPGQGTPPATTTLVNKIGYQYKGWRNKTTQDATTYSLFNDDTVTVDQKAAVSDSGTVFTRGEVATGP